MKLIEAIDKYAQHLERFERLRYRPRGSSSPRKLHHARKQIAASDRVIAQHPFGIQHVEAKDEPKEARDR